jgi:hypothetical protein
MSQATSSPTIDLSKPSFRAAMKLASNAVKAAAHAEGRFEAPNAADKAIGKKLLLELLWQVDAWDGGFRGHDDASLADMVERVFGDQVTMAEVTDALWTSGKPWPTSEQVAA